MTLRVLFGTTFSFTLSNLPWTGAKFRGDIIISPDLLIPMLDDYWLLHYYDTHRMTDVVSNTSDISNEDPVHRAVRIIQGSTKNQLVTLCTSLAKSLDSGTLSVFAHAETSAAFPKIMIPISCVAADKLTHILTTFETNLTQEAPSKKLKKQGRDFNFSRYRYRHVALNLMYLGEQYLGLAAQTEDYGSGTEHSTSKLKSIESHLFEALHTTKLLPNNSREDANYQRCGRTDKGVSAAGQIVSLRLRSKAQALTQDSDPADPLAGGEEFPSPEHELDYVGMINKILPKDIRVTGWCDVGPHFSARHSASYRVYRYFFVRRGFDIEKMKLAAHELEGTHDFRNFCKPDVANVKTFVRHIISCNIHPLKSFDPNEVRDHRRNYKGYLRERHQIFFIELVGNAFLWHQVRCVVAILFLVGKHLEEPSVIQKLLDPECFPGRPFYNMASEAPLVLYHCHFHSLPFWCPPATLRRLTQNVEKLWSDTSIRLGILSDILQKLYNYRVPMRKDTEGNMVDKPMWSRASSVESLLPNYDQAIIPVNEEDPPGLVRVGAVDPRVPRLLVPKHALPGTVSCEKELERRSLSRWPYLQDRWEWPSPTPPESKTAISEEVAGCLPVTDCGIQDYWTWGELLQGTSILEQEKRKEGEQLKKVLDLDEPPDEHVEHGLGYRSRQTYSSLMKRKQEPSIEEKLKKQKR